MKIAIEALGIHSYGGGRTATINLIKNILSIDNCNEYLLFISQKEPELYFKNAYHYVFPMRNRFAMRIYAQLVLPFLARDCDLIHFAKNMGIFGLNIPYIVTIYDVATLIYPQIFPKIDILYWKYIQKLILSKAAKIIAISWQTAKDLQKFYKLPFSKIKVIYPACSPNFHPASAEDIKRVRTKYNLPEQYILHVGRIDPRKNIPLLIKSFALFYKKAKFNGTLVLVGDKYKKKTDNTVYDLIYRLQLHDRIQLLGAVPDADLPALYTGATMAVFPSIYEGFGIAALEALACGTPVIVNKGGAITEVVGDAALIMEQNTPECLVELMLLLWNNSSLRQILKEAGPKRASIFSWEYAALQTINTYLEVKNNDEN